MLKWLPNLKFKLSISFYIRLELGRVVITLRRSPRSTARRQ